MLTIEYTEEANQIDFSNIAQAFLDLRSCKREIDKKHLSTSGSPKPLHMAEYRSELEGYRRSKIQILEQSLKRLGYSLTSSNSIFEVISPENRVVATLYWNADLRIMESAKCRNVLKPSWGFGAREPWMPKQYVMDDLGTPTRRFAFCVKRCDPRHERPEHKWNTSGLRKIGDFWEHPSDGPAVEDFIQSGLTRAVSAEVGMMAMWLHQERGGLLGVCLSSTPKRLKDNSGTPFAKTPGDSFWVIDLARVPPLVINLYGRPELLRGVANRSSDGRDWTREQAREHMLQSVTKNRELFAQNIPPDACKRIRIPPDWLGETEVDWKGEPILLQAINSFLP